MTKTKTAMLYLALIVTVILIGAALTFIRADLGSFDPKLTFGLTAITLVSVMSTLGAVVGGNMIISYFLRHPVFVVLWIPFGTGLTVLVHHLFAGYFGLMELDRIGVWDAFLMYLPSVGLFSLIGGLMASLLRRRGTPV